MAQESEPNFTGEARLYAPYGCSWGAVYYDPDEDGIIVVPSAAVADMLSFPPICPETMRPVEPTPEPDPRAAEVTNLRTQIVEADKMIAARDHRIAELEGQLGPVIQPAKVEQKAPATAVKPATKA